MEKELIEFVAREEGLPEEKIPLFVDFFSKRFPDEDNRITTYCATWANRFKDGSPDEYMDKESKQIYYDLSGTKDDTETTREELWDTFDSLTPAKQVEWLLKFDIIFEIVKEWDITTLKENIEEMKR